MAKILKKVLVLVVCFAFIFSGAALVFDASVKIAKADQEPRVVEKIADVYLIAGQSNAVGSTLIANGNGPCYEEQNNKSFADSTLKYPNVLYNHLAHPTTKGNGYYITDFVPVTQGLGYTQAKNHIGPELGMAQILDPIYAEKENTDAIIIKVASGGTTLTHHYDDANLDLDALIAQNSYDGNFGTWYPESMWNVCFDDYKVDLWGAQFYNHPTGFLYRKLVEFIRLNYEMLQEKGYTQINFKSMAWMQGCSDRGRESEYRTCFKAFTSDLRARLTEITGEDYSNFPIVSGEISETFSSANEGTVNANKKFIAMQNELTRTIHHTYTIPSASFHINELNANGINYVNGSDSAHFNYPDMVELGRMFGEKCYSVDASDKWMYLDIFASREDRYDRTTLENVKLDIDEFNDNGTLSFDCTLDSLYNITSLKIKDGAYITEHLTETINGSQRVYSIKGLPVDNSKDITLEASFENAKVYSISLSMASEGDGYGSKIYTYPSKVYAGVGQVSFKALPSSDGRVYKVTVNGIEVAGAKNKTDIVIDNIFDYLNGQESFNIVVQYGAIPKPHIEASGYISTFEVGETFSVGDLVVKFLDELENETVISQGEYTIDSSRFNSSTVGNYLIEIKSGTYSTSYVVSVVAPTLEIENAKTVFIKGEQFSIGAPQVYLVTKAGRTLLDASQYVAIAPLYNANVPGEYDVIISAATASGTYKVMVIQPTTVTVENAKTEFSGEEFSAGDLVVKVVVNGNEFTLDESQYTVDSSAFKQNKNGTYTITVTAGGVSATYYVTVSGVASSASAGCGASVGDVLALVVTLCGLAFVFKRK